MKKAISLIDRGRGLQLSTSRITVHDLVPYVQDGCPYDEIIRWIPSLTHKEIAIVERYYRQHKDELDEHGNRNEDAAIIDNSGRTETGTQIGTQTGMQLVSTILRN